MMRHGWIVCGILSAGLLVGCAEPTTGTSRPLGDVGYELAFSTARETMGDYFSVAESNADTGVIRCRPKLVDAPGERILGGSPARHMAKMYVRREGEGIVAQVSVAIQRQGSEGFRNIGLQRDSYSGVPKQTPAELEGATTPEQNDVWRVERQDKTLEIRILADLYERLHPIGTGENRPD